MRVLSVVHRSRRGIVVAGVLLITAAVLFVVELRRRGDLYWYDVTRNYRYSFSDRNVVSLPVRVSSDGFLIPTTEMKWDTALLRIRVEGSVASHWFEPSITIGNGTSEIDRQFLDRGAEGDRYVLLRRDMIPSSGRIVLRGNHLRWPPQTGQLRLFANPTPSSGRVLVLAPHPDDAEIAAFGLYSRTDSFVVTITPGNYVDGTLAHLAPDADGQDTLKGDIRTWDSLFVPSWGGVSPERTANLGYLGLSLRRLYAERHVAAVKFTSPDPKFGRFRRGALDVLVPGRSATPTWGSLVDDLAVLLSTVRPAIIVAPHPSLDISEDHQLTTVALLEALERSGNDVTLFLYTNHHVFSEYYPFGPADAGVTMPPWFDESLTFSSVYSVRLDAAQRTEKLFALDAMHDLRSAPRLLVGGPADRLLSRLGRSLADLVRDPVSDYSYYRRAVRPNELFFVYRSEDQELLRRRTAASTRVQ
jgi:LmbE family N-acetylglucosaminyl deacetylase